MEDNQNFMKIAITNRHLCVDQTDPIRALITQIKRLSNSHYERIVLREKDLSEEEYYALAKSILDMPQVTEKKNFLFLHNFYLTALKLDIKNIHLPLHVFQKLVEEDSNTLQFFTEIGTSIHSIEDAMLAERLGATYVFAGHVFETDCKKGLLGRGIPWLTSIVNSVSIPVYAIGGMSDDRLDDISKTGACGACFMSEAMRA